MVLRGHCLRWWEGPSGRSYIFCRSPRATWNCFWAVNTVSQVLNPLGSRKITARYSDGATHAFLAYSLIRLRRVFLSLWGTFTFQQSLPYAWFSVYVYAYGQMFIYVLECFLTKQCWSKAHCQSNHGSSVILPGSCLLLAKLFWGHYSRPVSSTNRSGISAGAVHFSWIAGVCRARSPTARGPAMLSPSGTPISRSRAHSEGLAQDKHSLSCPWLALEPQVCSQILKHKAIYGIKREVSEFLRKFKYNHQKMGSVL